VIDMAGPNKFADGGIMYALAAVTACAALLALVLGAFSALRGRPLLIFMGQGLGLKWRSWW
jgi:hypothetical protein